jgi:hypothetical protein
MLHGVEADHPAIDRIMYAGRDILDREQRGLPWSERYFASEAEVDAVADVFAASGVD